MARLVLAPCTASHRFFHFTHRGIGDIQREPAVHGSTVHMSNAKFSACIAHSAVEESHVNFQQGLVRIKF